MMKLVIFRIDDMIGKLVMCPECLFPVKMVIFLSPTLSSTRGCPSPGQLSLNYII